MLPPDKGGDITVDPTRRADAGVTPDSGRGPDGSTLDPDGGVVNNDGGPVDAGPVGVAPTLDSVSASQAGRDGQDLLISVVGTDPDGDLAAVVVRCLDSSGTELPLMDTDLDGHRDSGYVVGAPYPSVAGETEFTARITFDDLFLRSADIARVELYALDARGRASEIMESVVIGQSVLRVDEACDEALVWGRCDEGLGCLGQPAICTAGSPPSLSDFAYYSTPAGLRILLRGRDVDDDVRHVVLEFLDAGGGPVQLDLDNDGTPDGDTFEVDAAGSSQGGEFFIAMQPTDNFSQLVQQMGATPLDSRQRAGNRLTTRLANPPNRRVAESCDPQGFDACRTGDVCYPGIPGENNACSPKEGRRGRICADSDVLNPLVGKNTAVGVARGASLWDPPVGCAALDPKGRPEGVVMLDLPNGARQVTLTTDLPGTGYNTVLYVIDGCEFDHQAVLGCHDNVASGTGSELVLENVDAGRYLVVVDSWNTFGGAFEVQVEVQE